MIVRRVQVRPITQPMYRLQWQVQLASFNRQELVDKMLHYVDSDPVCMRTPVDTLSRKVCRPLCPCVL